MTKYVLAYHGGGMPANPEEGQKIMAAWNSWMGGLGKALVDGGHPTGPAKTIAKDGRISDGGGVNPITRSSRRPISTPRPSWPPLSHPRRRRLGGSRRNVRGDVRLLRRVHRAGGFGPVGGALVKIRRSVH